MMIKRTSSLNNKEPIESGVVGDVVKKLVTSIGKGMGSLLSKVGESIAEDAKSNKSDGSFQFTMRPKDSGLPRYVIRFSQPQKTSDGTYMATVSFRDPGSKYYENVGKVEATDAEFRDIINDDELRKLMKGFEERVLEQYRTEPKKEDRPKENPLAEDEESTEVKEAQALKITLKSVMSSSGSEVHLSRIYSSYDPMYTMDAVNTVLDSLPVLDIPESGTASFSICSDDTDNTFDVEPCELPAIDLQTSIDALLVVLYKLYNTILYLRSMTRRIDQCIYDELMYLCTTQSDIYTSWLRENNLIVRCPAYYFGILNEDPTICDTSVMDLDADIRAMSECIDIYYCNFSHDYQYILDKFETEWKSHLSTSSY